MDFRWRITDLYQTLSGSTVDNEVRINYMHGQLFRAVFYCNSHKRQNLATKRRTYRQRYD